MAATRPEAGPIEKLQERHAEPFGRADGPQAPLLARDRRLEAGAAVAGALEGDGPDLRRHLDQVRQVQAEVAPDQPADAQAPAGQVQLRDREVVPDVELPGRYHAGAHQLSQRRLAVDHGVHPRLDRRGQRVVGSPEVVAKRPAGAELLRESR